VQFLALLESLIKTANDNGITFVYALSPGIDVIYSNTKEVKAIQDKFAQVGC
jgi:protein O-GlcNAcase/histone acetyltransferase